MITTTLKELAQLCHGQLINAHQDCAVSKVSIDTRKMDGAQIYIPIIGEQFDGHQFVNKAFENGALVSLFQKDHDHSNYLSPLILVDDTTRALGTLAHNYLKKIGAKVIGVTGSNGKTSTKDILAQLLSSHYKVEKTLGNFNNVIGLPLTILAMKPDTEIAVLEMGMNSLGEIRRLTEIAPVDIAIITSIGSAHLYDLGSVDNIIQAKLEITDHLNPHGMLIYNGDHVGLKNAIRQRNFTQKTISYGSHSDNDILIEAVTQFAEGLVFTAEGLSPYPIETNLMGRFQAHNVVAALLACQALNIKVNQLQEGLINLQLTGHRNEISFVKQAVIIDDSYKSNPESLKSALDLLKHYHYESKKIVVLGDMLDLGPDEVKFHQEIGASLADYGVSRIYTIGTLAKHFHDGNQIVGEHFNNQEDLFKSLLPWLNQPSTILIKASNSLKLFELAQRLKQEEK